MNLVFTKSGCEIKSAIGDRRRLLQERLDRRNKTLDDFIQHSGKVRSYLVRSAPNPWAGHSESASGLFGKGDISSEEQREIAQLCNRIYEIEQELLRLDLVLAHLEDDRKFELDFNELVGYGFQAEE